MSYLYRLKKIVWWICEKALTLRLQNLKQMAIQHCNILIIKGIQSLKDFERNACVLMPSTTGTSYC